MVNELSNVEPNYFDGWTPDDEHRYSTVYEAIFVINGPRWPKKERVAWKVMYEIFARPTYNNVVNSSPHLMIFYGASDFVGQ